MTILVSGMTRRLEETLLDVGSVRWKLAEHYDAINDAQAEILKVRPDLFETYIDHLLVPGNEQSIPAGGYLLFDILWNIDEDSVQGRRITRVARSVLDRHRASWTEKNANVVVRHWAQDVRERVKFFVAPRQPDSTSQKVRMRYAKRPAVIDSQGDSLDTPDERINSVYYFCMMRLLEKDGKFSGSVLAQSFAKMFAVSLSAGNIGETEAEATKDVNEG